MCRWAREAGDGLATIHCHTERETRVLESIRRRHEDEDEGFTLIELMVVVLIIAILLAIAIPTFLGARERSQDRAAQSDIRNALAAEKVFFTDKEGYQTATGDDISPTEAASPDGDDLKEIEPQLTYIDWAGADNSDVTEDAIGVWASDAEGTPPVYTGDPADIVRAEMVCLAKKSKSGKYFFLVDIAKGASAGTYYYKVEVTDDADSDTGPVCSGGIPDDIATLDDEVWSKTGF